MAEVTPLSSALISVYHKKGLEPLAEALKSQGLPVYSTGGTADYLRELGCEVHDVAELTGYPSILGGRVKTLHPKVHGGILARRAEAGDQEELAKYEIPKIDLVVVDLYPFEETVASGADEAAVIEKIDIGGIALIRGAAKNFKDVAIVPSQRWYGQAAEWLAGQGGFTLDQRKTLAAAAFDVSSHYDSHIHRYLAGESQSLKISVQSSEALRYGENPHQQAWYYGDINSQFEQLHGKALSYNNLVDIEAALDLVDEFDEPFFAVLKHTNPCGCAVGTSMLDAWNKALAGDPLSAFGGVLVCNGSIDEVTAAEINKLFFEVLIAEGFDDAALKILQKKKNRILLKRVGKTRHQRIEKSMLDGYLVQEKNLRKLQAEDLAFPAGIKPDEAQLADAFFGDKVVKHLKSNAIAIVKGGQLIGSGVGQTSRVDALKQAIDKAGRMGFDLEGSTLSSDAFFPFKDSVELAHAAGIGTIVEPGGSMRDQETIDYCTTHGLCLIFTAIRHFKH
ncbi:MAG: bifunctional phosphoribosylaminoimidazolecarboxamide formyltransferase/IMP cyclohydrolase [Bacteroidia bacterium]